MTVFADSDSYTRNELREATGLPERGELCHQCGVRVPQFAEMDEALYQRLVNLIDSQRGLMAMKELMSALECPNTYAKIWISHRGKAKPTYPGPPCPYCGGPLRTSRAKQCPHCFEAWHHKEPPAPKYSVFLDVVDAVESVKRFEGRPEDFQLPISEEMLDPVGMNMAIVGDAVLSKGWTVDGYHQMDGFRIYRYKTPD